jgi:iron(III) transport system substrate-binding protein
MVMASAGKASLGRRDVLRGLGVVAGAGLLGGVAGCSGGDTTAKGKPNSSGKATGKLVVYATTVPPVQERLVKAFTAKTGIKVESLRLATGALAQRFMGEQRAGQHMADVITLGDELVFKDLVKQNMLKDIKGIKGYDAIPSDWNPQQRYVLFSQSPETILYNTDLVDGNALPLTWGHLLDPKYKGQILMADPRNNQVSQGQTFLAIAEQYGDDWFRSFGKQKVRLTSNAPAATETVAAGGGSIAFPGLNMNLLPFVGTGAPIATIPAAPSPTSMLYFFSGLVETGPNPQEAQAWAEFTLSPEGQQLINDGVGISFYGTKIKGSLPKPDKVLTTSAKEALEKLPHFLDLLGIGA